MSSASDLTARILRRVRAAQTRARFRLGFETLEPGPARLAPGFRHPIDLSRRAGLIARYRAAFASDCAREIEEAQRLLSHRFRLLGHEMHHGPRIEWSRDPVSGRCWSHAFSPDIPYRGPERLGDIKLPWELNKHQYFFTLGKAGWLQEDPRHAREIIAQIDDWIAANPPYRGIHWISALEAGTRVISWTLAYPFIAEQCDEAFRQRLARSIAQHLLFVERNLSVSQFANTHLAGEAAVLAIGALFIESPRSERWLRTGLLHLEEQIDRQVHADGAHAEQSIAYHRFFLDQYYLVHAFLAANGKAFSPQTYRRMECMTQFLQDALWPNGTAPAFGDCDDARTIWCRADCPQDFRSLLVLGAVLFQRGDFKYVSRGVTEELLWLHGEPGFAAYEALRAHPPGYLSSAYPDAGYYFMRAGWGEDDPVLAFDCGPLGYGAAGHGHADALSLQLYAQRWPFLTDSGTYSYNLDYAWRDAFRATVAHSTIAIDGTSQSVPRDRMSWAHKATARARTWVTTAQFDLVDGEHDGYARLSDPVLHRRIVVYLKPDAWIICDRLQTQGTHELTAMLHASPEARVEPLNDDGTAVVLIAPGGARLNIRSLGAESGADRLEVVRGGPEPEGSWISREYGTKTSGLALRVRRTFSGTASLLHCLSSGSDTPCDARVHDNHLVVATADGAHPQLIYRLDDTGTYENGALAFEGRLLYLGDDESERHATHAREFTRLRVPGLLGIESPAPVTELHLRDGQVFLQVPETARESVQIALRAGLTLSVNGEPATSRTLSP